MNISIEKIKEFCMFIEDKFGFALTFEDEKEFEAKVRPWIKSFGCHDLEQFIDTVLKDPFNKEKLGRLATCLTIGETYFFRDPEAFAILEKNIIPEIMDHKSWNENTLRIWSAASCSGEEAYSIAILMDRILRSKEYKIDILASDINHEFLEKARSAMYKEWSFRGDPYQIKSAYFKQIEDRYELSPKIRKKVHFFYLNLVEDSYPSLTNQTNAMDLILCNNVLIYFSPKQIAKVIQQLSQCLVEGGWLMTSSIEVPFVVHPDLKPYRFSNTVFFKKETVEKPIKEIIWEIPVQPGVESMDSVEVTKPKQESYTEALKLYKAGRYGEAIQYIEARIEKNRDKNDELAVLLIRSWANQGKLQEALNQCDRAINIDKLNPIFHYLQAVILQELEEREKAMVSLKRALFLDTDFVMAHFALGMLLRKEKKREANNHFQIALKLLKNYRNEETVLGSGEITVGRLREVIHDICRE